MSRLLKYVVCITAVILPLTGTKADIVFLKNSTLFEGKIVSESSDKITLKTPSGKLHIQRSNVDEILRNDMIPFFKVSQIKFKSIDISRAKKVLLKVKEATTVEEFDKLASQFNDSESVGGDMGFKTIGDLTNPPLESKLFRMKVGETSGIVRTLDGLFILRVTGARYQDRITKEFFSTDKKALPLADIKVRLYQVNCTGMRSGDERLGQKVYDAVRDALKAHKAVQLTEEPSLAPEQPDLPTSMQDANYHFAISFDASLSHDVVRISYKIIDLRHMGGYNRDYGTEAKTGTGTFQGLKKIKVTAEGFAEDIYNFIPKTIDEEKLKKEIKKAEDKKKKDKENKEVKKKPEKKQPSEK